MQERSRGKVKAQLGAALLAPFAVAPLPPVPRAVLFGAFWIPCVVACFRAARREQLAERSTYRWLGVSLLLFAVDIQFWMTLDALGHGALKVPAVDPVAALALIFASVGLTAHLRRRPVRSPIESWLEALIAAAGATALALFIALPLLLDGETAWPVTETVLHMVVLGGLFSAPIRALSSPAATSSDPLIVAGAGTILLREIVLATGSSASSSVVSPVPSALAMLCFVLVAFAAHLSADAPSIAMTARPHRGRSDGAAILVLFLAALVPMGLGVVALSTRDYSRVWVASGATWIIGCLVAVRLGMALRRTSDAAISDPLCGIANRRGLEEIIRLRSHLTATRPHFVGVLFFDLDRFKNVNDELGHDVGDTVLRVVAERISGEIRPLDLAARIGGDEFVVVLHVAGQTEEEASAAVPEVASRIVTALAAPVATRAGEVEVSVSVGVAVMSSSDAYGEGVHGLLRRADRAMYSAKKAGRGRISLVSA